MNEEPHPPLSPGEVPPAEASASSLSRFRESVADALFHISRAYPRFLALHSAPGAWTAIRILMGAAGAGLVVLPLSLWNSWAFAIAGLVLFLTAVLLPPLRQDRGAAKAREQLGAYLVLDGGRVSSGNNEAPTVNLYLTPTRVWALDEQLRPVAIIPTDEITLVSASPSKGDWILRVRWQSASAEFLYAGLFAERRARLAEKGLRHLVRSAEAPRARARAAGA